MRAPRRIEGTQKIAVEAAQPRAQRIFSKRNFRLLDGCRKHHVDPDHARAALDDGRENAADLTRPDDGGRALEG